MTLLSALMYSAGETAKKERHSRYELNVRDKQGRWMGLLCYEEPYGNEYEFALNQVGKAFSEVRLAGDKAIDSVSPVPCYAYPFEMFDLATREKVVAAQKDEGGRIVVIGDSWAYGEAVPIGDSFPELMNILLRRHGNAGGWSVVNLARSGLLLPDIYNQAFLKALAMKPKRIVFAWSVRSMPSAWKVDKQRPVKTGAYSSRTSKYRIPETLDRKSAELLRSYVEMMKATAAAAGINFNVALLPAFTDVDSERRNVMAVQKRVAATLAGEGVPVFDLSKVISKEMNAPADSRPDYRNPDVAAQFKVAIALINDLKLTRERIDPSIYFRKPSVPRALQGRSPSSHPSETAFSKFMFFFTAVLLGALVLSFIFVAPEILRLMSREKKPLLILSIFIAISAFILRRCLAPHSHLTYLDEYDRYRLIFMWLQGHFGANTADNIPGSMLPYFLAYKVFGAAPSVGFALTSALSAAAALMLYAALRLAWKNPWIAALATAFLAASPLNIRFAASHSIDAINVLFLLAALFAALLDLRNSNHRTRLFMAAACSFALFVRIDNAAFVLILFPMWIAARRSSANTAKSEFLRLPDVAAALFAAAAMSVYAAYLFVCVATTSQSAHVVNILHNISMNLPGNAMFFFKGGLMPVAITLLSVFGAVEAFRNPLREQRFKPHIFLAAWIVAHFAIHLMSAAGGYETERFRDTARYANHFLPALVCFAAAGLVTLSALIPVAMIRIPIAAAVITYILLSPLTAHDAITRESEFMTINKTVVDAAGRYLPQTRFYTNSALVYDILEIDANRNISLVNAADAAPRFCGGEECVFVFYTRGKSARLHRRGMDCQFRFVAGPGNIYFCGAAAANAMPAYAWKDPDANYVTGVSAR